MKALRLLPLLLVAVSLQAQISSPGFVENRGQWPDEVRYRLELDGMSLWITDHGAVYDLHERVAPAFTMPRFDLLDAADERAMPMRDEPTIVRGHVLRAEFVGASAGARAVGGEEMSGRYSFFLGNDRDRWGRDCRTYASVRLTDLYEGIDAVYYLDDGVPRFDLIVAPGADPARLGIRMHGAERTALLAGGDVAFATSRGDLTMANLFVYQTNAKGERCQITSRFTIDGDTIVRFALGAYDRRRPLVVDPLTYCSLLGGGANDEAHGVAVDNKGNTYISGRYIQDPDWRDPFPNTEGAYTTEHNSSSFRNVFVAKLSANGSTLVYSAVIGGSHDDYVYGIVVDPRGSAVICGTTGGHYIPRDGYPVTSGAVDTTFGGHTDVFVTRLSPDGSDLEYSTFLGGSGQESAQSLALDPEGNAYVTGSTVDSSSTGENYPSTPGSFAPQHGGNNDVFVTKLNPNGSELIYSTFLGGFEDDFGTDIAIDRNGAAYVTGYIPYTRLFDITYPTTEGAFNRIHSGKTDVFVTKLSPDGSTLEYSTLMGGTLELNDLAESKAFGIAVDTNGSAYICGTTVNNVGPLNYPITSGAYVSPELGGPEVFVTKLSPDGSRLEYSAIMGGYSHDEVSDIVLDASGNAYVTGQTQPYTSRPEARFPTTEDAYLRDRLGRNDVYLMKLDVTGSRLLFSTLLGGSDQDLSGAIGLDSLGRVVVVGHTAVGIGDSAFTTTFNAFDRTYAGRVDAFIAKFSLPLSDIMRDDRRHPWRIDLR